MSRDVNGGCKAITILIVDDSETSRLLLGTILDAAGFKKLLYADSSAKALNILGSDNPEQVGLVLMDIKMPGLDGIETVRRLRTEDKLRDIPVIMVTAVDDEECLEDAFDAGATDYLRKPVSRVELRARVRSLLRLKLEMDSRREREQELEKLTRHLETISNQDGLTGVANRRCFEGVLETEWGRSLRNAIPLSALMIDIDFFKAYNDTYGHIQGDACLRDVADAIRYSCTRPGDFLARYGGEEFVALLPGTDVEGAMTVARQIQENLHEKHLPHASSRAGNLVTVSIGMATILPKHDMNHVALIAASDEALYQAKNDGRDCIRAHTPVNPA